MSSKERKKNKTESDSKLSHKRKSRKSRKKSHYKDVLEPMYILGSGPSQNISSNSTMGFHPSLQGPFCLQTNQMQSKWNPYQSNNNSQMVYFADDIEEAIESGYIVEGPQEFVSLGEPMQQGYSFYPKELISNPEGYVSNMDPRMNPNVPFENPFEVVTSISDPRMLTQVRTSDDPHVSTLPAASHMSTLPAAPHMSTLPAASHMSTLPAASHMSTLPAAPHMSTLPAASHVSTLPAAPERISDQLSNPEINAMSFQNASDPRITQQSKHYSGTLKSSRASSPRRTAKSSSRRTSRMTGILRSMGLKKPSLESTVIESKEDFVPVVIPGSNIYRTTSNFPVSSYRQPTLRSAASSRKVGEFSNYDILSSKRSTRPMENEFPYEDTLSSYLSSDQISGINPSVLRSDRISSMSGLIRTEDVINDLYRKISDIRSCLCPSAYDFSNDSPVRFTSATRGTGNFGSVRPYRTTTVVERGLSAPDLTRSVSTYTEFFDVPPQCPHNCCKCTGPSPDPLKLDKINSGNQTSMYFAQMVSPLNTNQNEPSLLSLGDSALNINGQNVLDCSPINEFLWRLHPVLIPCFEHSPSYREKINQKSSNCIQKQHTSHYRLNQKMFTPIDNIRSTYQPIKSVQYTQMGTSNLANVGNIGSKELCACNEAKARSVLESLPEWARDVLTIRGSSNFAGSNLQSQNGSNLFSQRGDSIIPQMVDNLTSQMGYENSQMFANLPSQIGGYQNSQMFGNLPSQMGGYQNSQMFDNLTSQMGGYQNSQMFDNLTSQMGDSQNSQMFGNLTSQMGDSQNSQMFGNLPSQMGGYQNSQMFSNLPSQIGGYQNSQMFDNLTSQMGTSQNSQMFGNLPSQMGGYQNSQMFDNLASQMSRYQTSQLGNNLSTLIKPSKSCSCVFIKDREVPILKKGKTSEFSSIALFPGDDLRHSCNEVSVIQPPYDPLQQSQKLSTLKTILLDTQRDSTKPPRFVSSSNDPRNSYEENPQEIPELSYRSGTKNMSMLNAEGGNVSKMSRFLTDRGTSMGTRLLYSTNKPEDSYYDINSPFQEKQGTIYRTASKNTQVLDDSDLRGASSYYPQNQTQLLSSDGMTSRYIDRATSMHPRFLSSTQPSGDFYDENKSSRFEKPGTIYRPSSKSTKVLGDSVVRGTRSFYPMNQSRSSENMLSRLSDRGTSVRPTYLYSNRRSGDPYSEIKASQLNRPKTMYCSGSINESVINSDDGKVCRCVPNQTVASKCCIERGTFVRPVSLSPTKKSGIPCVGSPGSVMPGLIPRSGTEKMSLVNDVNGNACHCDPSRQTRINPTEKILILDRDADPSQYSKFICSYDYPRESLDGKVSSILEGILHSGSKTVEVFESDPEKCSCGPTLERQVNTSVFLKNSSHLPEGVRCSSKNFGDSVTEKPSSRITKIIIHSDTNLCGSEVKEECPCDPTTQSQIGSSKSTEGRDSCLEGNLPQSKSLLNLANKSNDECEIKTITLDSEASNDDQGLLVKNKVTKITRLRRRRRYLEKEPKTEVFSLHSPDAKLHHEPVEAPCFENDVSVPLIDEHTVYNLCKVNKSFYKVKKITLPSPKKKIYVIVKKKNKLKSVSSVVNHVTSHEFSISSTTIASVSPSYSSKRSRTKRIRKIFINS